MNAAAQQLVLDYLEQLDDVGIDVPSNVLFAAENGTVCTCGLDAGIPTDAPVLPDYVFVPQYVLYGDCQATPQSTPVLSREEIDRLQREYNELMQPVPAWQRAKVGDRVRLREGSVSPVSPYRTLDNPALLSNANCSRRDVRFCVNGWYIRNDDILEILPPLPESKFGFTVGETVNTRKSHCYDNPGTVVGFSDYDVLVDWTRGFKRKPHSHADLRHGP